MTEAMLVSPWEVMLVLAAEFRFAPMRLVLLFEVMMMSPDFEVKLA